MIFQQTKLKGAYLIDLEPFQDQRGLFARTYCQREFRQIGHWKPFVQFNHSLTRERGVIRGLHYQRPPHAEIKLIRCVRGRVFDVMIDLRRGSPTFLQYIGVELSDQNRRMIYIPEGFAHGFQTLEDNTELIYHHTAFYTPEAEGGLRYDDPLLNVQWPLAPTYLSEKDQNHLFVDDNFKGINYESNRKTKPKNIRQ